MSYDLQNPTHSVHDIANLFLRGLMPNGNANTGIPVGFADGPSLDPFGRVRVSNPLSLFANKQLYDNQPLFWNDVQVTGTATTTTYNTNKASTTIAVANVTFGKRLRQTYRRFNYQSGKGQSIVMTGNLSPDGNTNGITREIGIFDDHNGLFFRYVAGILYVVKRSNSTGSPVDSVVAQSAWNLDKMDGTGISGLTLDITKAQIFVIDFQWLGVGRVRFGVEIDGCLFYVHELNNSNVVTSVYMSVPNLPLRYSISNDGTGGAAGLDHICSAVTSEAGFDDVGVSLSTNREATGLTTLNNASLYPIVGIRLRSDRNGGDVRLSRATLICDSTSSFLWKLILNPTVVGTALTWNNLTNSVVQTTNTSTNATTLTGGVVLDSGYAVSTQGQIQVNLGRELVLGNSYAGVSDELYLSVIRLSAQTETFYGSLTWVETV